jgi:hypothetical protein
MSRYQLAQVNVGVIRGPMDSPIMADFAANLDRINAFPPPDGATERTIDFGDVCPAT